MVFRLLRAAGSFNALTHMGEFEPKFAGFGASTLHDCVNPKEYGERRVL